VSPDVSVVDVPDASRYVIEVDGRPVGLLSYRLSDGTVAMMHAEINPAVERHGLGSSLVAFALDDARARALSVLPYCPFVRSYIAEHPQYQDLVPEDSRADFGL
jgi:hypothetical protein